MKKYRTTFLKYLTELLIVAFGVFLGVYVSDWNAQKKTDKNTERTLDFITNEITSNILKLENSIEYQLSFTKSVDSLFNGLEKEDFESAFYGNKKFKLSYINNYKGLGFSNLEDVMFESAKINGVLQELNISTTQLIARLYQKQENYLNFTEQVKNNLLNIDSQSTIGDILGIFELVKYDGISTEKWLLNELTKTYEKLVKLKKASNFKQ